MSNSIPGNHKHLILNDRIYIEESLIENKSFREIARYLCKDPSTISKEVWRKRVVNTWNRGSFNNPHNFCIHRFRCKKTNVCQFCKRIAKAPYVCNGCETPRNKCTIGTKYDYNAKAAQRAYKELRSASREGVNLTKKELRHLDKVVSPLSAQGQSPYIIIANHLELGISVSTLYNYIESGLLLSRNVDLKRKVKFKKKKCHNTQIKNRDVFHGRTYADFKSLDSEDLVFWEMDTVKSARGSSKCILTFYFPEYELLISRLMNLCTPGAVKLEFNRIQKALGDNYDFMFQYILTDRGVEFGDPESLEKDSEDRPRVRFFTMTLCAAIRRQVLKMIIPCSVLSSPGERFLKGYPVGYPKGC